MGKIGNSKWTYGIVWLITLFVSQVFAETKIEAEFVPDVVSPGEQAEYVISVTSDEKMNISPPTSLNMKGLRFQKGPPQESFSQSRTMQQGESGFEFKSHVVQQFIYSFIAEQKGVFKSGPVQITIAGKEQAVPEATLTIGDQGSGAGGGQVRRRKAPSEDPLFPFGFDPTEDLSEAEEQLFNQLRGRRGFGGFGGGRGGAPAQRSGPEPQFRSMPENADEAFFIQIEVDKTEVYEGEQITASWYVYTRGIMETFDRLKFPDLRGFWKEIIEEVPALNFSEEIVNDVSYRKALIASHALFPIKAGESNIDSFKVRSRVRMQNPFGIGFGRAYEYTKVSKPVKIKVLPLPQEGKPPTFSGAVGDFEVNAVAEGTTFPVNQPLVYKIRFEGKGNAKLIELPAIQWPDGLEMYDVKSEAKFFKEGTSYKQFEVLVIPRKKGEMILPEIDFAVFNPATKKYVIQRTPSQIIQVVDNPSGNVAQNADQSFGNTPEKKVATAKPSLPPPMVQLSSGAAATAQAWPIFSLIAFGFIAGGLGLQARRDLGLGSRKMTLKLVVKRRWKIVTRAHRSGDLPKMAGEVMNCYSIAVGEISRQTRAIPLDRLIDLAPASLRSEHGAAIRENFDYFQTICFAPKEALQELERKDLVQRNLDHAKRLINLLIERTEERKI